MTLKTYRGSCHCGRVRYEADLDLAAGTSKCNCSICTKTRGWGTSIKPAALRLVAGEEELVDYRFRPDSTIRHPFCRHCGVRCFCSGGYVEELGGDFVSINVATLDDATPDELVSGPIQYCDGRANNWWQPPSDVRHL